MHKMMQCMCNKLGGGICIWQYGYFIKARVSRLSIVRSVYRKSYGLLMNVAGGGVNFPGDLRSFLIKVAVRWAPEMPPVMFV